MLINISLLHFYNEGWQIFLRSLLMGLRGRQLFIELLCKQGGSKGYIALGAKCV